jgi:hypothetical protein
MWFFVILISALFIFCMSLIFVHSTAEGATDIVVVYDTYATTKVYKDLFAVFSAELLQFMKENRSQISGRHRVFVLEFCRIFDPTDVVIFIYLDRNQILKDPLLVHRERTAKLKDVASMKAFVDKAIKNLVQIINEKERKKYEMIIIPGRNPGFLFAQNSRNVKIKI